MDDITMKQARGNLKGKLINVKYFWYEHYGIGSIIFSN